MSEFAIKDSGARQSFSSGMVRDTTEGKINYLSVRFGPMFRRWADHLTKGRVKYPDAAPGTPNWTLASGIEEYLRAKESAARHFEAWLNGERDEDHAAGLYFNVNLAEYVLESVPGIDPGMGATVVTRGADPAEQDATLDSAPVTAVARICSSCDCRSAHCHTGLEESDRECPVMSPDNQWFCERPFGHRGPHGTPTTRTVEYEW